MNQQDIRTVKKVIKKEKRMKVKKIWTDNDFDEMGWHDSRLYQLKFPDEDCNFILYIDYIFEWVKYKDRYKFWVSPCEMVFKNVIDLNLNLLFENSIGIDIDLIKREEMGLTPNGKMTDWKYQIETDRGRIEFTSTGFEMNLISQPILSKSQSINK